MFNRPLLSLVLLTVIAAGLSPTAFAMDIGGELELQAGVRHTDSWTTDLQGQVLLELYLPETPPFSTRFAAEGFLGSEQSDWRFKYLYLRWQGDNGQVTVGRQPVAWGYGSMLNPLGYGIDIQGLAGQSVVPAVDGIRYVHSLGSGRRLELVVDLPEGLTEQGLETLGYGGRLRWPKLGQDLSFNISSQPMFLPLGPDGAVVRERLLRTGVTYRGDAGPIGLYGALGYVRLLEAEEHDILLQVGLDTSWQWGSEYQSRPVILQAEYLRFMHSRLYPGLLLQWNPEQLEQDAAEEHTPEAVAVNDLLLLNLVVEWDYFTQFGAALMMPVGPGPKTLAPYYVTDLGGDVQLRLQGDITRLEAGAFHYGVRAGLTKHF